MFCFAFLEDRKKIQVIFLSLFLYGFEVSHHAQTCLPKSQIFCSRRQFWWLEGDMAWDEGDGGSWWGAHCSGEGRGSQRMQWEKGLALGSASQRLPAWPVRRSEDTHWVVQDVTGRTELGCQEPHWLRCWHRTQEGHAGTRQGECHRSGLGMCPRCRILKKPI